MGLKLHVGMLGSTWIIIRGVRHSIRLNLHLGRRLVPTITSELVVQL